MPDREVTFSQCKEFIPNIYNLKIHGCNGWENNLTHVEARETMMQIANHLGYTCTHRSAKKPEPTPQARQDIAATATLHGMGYRWSDTNQWWQPPKTSDAAELARGAYPERVTDPKRLVDAIQADMMEGLNAHAGWSASIVSKARAEATRGRYAERAESAVRAANASDSPTGADALQYLTMGVDLGSPMSTWPEALRQEERKQLAEVQQRANEAMTSHMLAITLALGLDYKPEGENILPAIEALQLKVGRIAEALGCTKTHPDLPEYAAILMGTHRLYSKQLELIRDVLAKAGLEEAHKWSENPRHIAGVVQKAIEAAKARLDTAAVNMHEIADALRLPQGSARISLVLPSVQALRAAMDQGFAAIKDHGYTPDRGETLGTLIRDAFGAEAAKLRQAKESAKGWQKAAAKLREESTDSNSAWHRGHVVGYTSGKDTERQRCTDIAQSAADRLDSAIALRIAQEIKNPA